MTAEARVVRSNKPIAFIQGGPPHLFHTTGMFYAWELSKDYSIILLATDSYKNQPWFNMLVKADIFAHIEYFPARNALATHSRLAKSIPLLLETSKPDIVLMHSEFFVDNLYLLHFLKQIAPDAKRFYFQPGRMGVNIEANSNARHAAQVDTLSKKLRLSAEFNPIVSKFVRIKNVVSFQVNCKLYPLLMIRKTFNPPVNYITGAILFDSLNKNDKKADQQGIHLQYTAIEIEAARTHGAVNVWLINHPMRSCATELMQLLHGPFTPNNSILIAPSYGFTSVLLAQGFSEQSVIETLTNAWALVFRHLEELYPEYVLTLKLHPAAIHDSTWKAIVRSLCEKHPKLQVIEGSEAAEIHVMKAKVVVGDVSSVLWWAALLGNKVVISLDIFSFPNGDELSNYQDFIWFFQDVNLIDNTLAPKVLAGMSNNNIRFMLNNAPCQELKSH